MASPWAVTLDEDEGEVPGSVRVLLILFRLGGAPSHGVVVRGWQDFRASTKDALVFLIDARKAMLGTNDSGEV